MSRGKSRPAIANTLRLLTLTPEVIGLVESGKLSAGHARTLVRVPKEQQYALAEEALRRGYSVREMERAVKAYLTPPEVLRQEKDAKASAKSEELKAFVERMRSVYRTKVSLIGNDKKLHRIGSDQSVRVLLCSDNSYCSCILHHNSDILRLR